MAELSELEMRILSELEEAGQEEIPTLINTVMTVTGDPSEIDDIEDALKELFRAGFARIAIDRDESDRLRRVSVEESLTLVSDLRKRLRFRESDKHWTDMDDMGPPYSANYIEPPYVVYTDVGKNRAFQILDERGYQWWRQKT